MESLEARRLLAYGAFPILIAQDAAVKHYPTVDGRGEVIVDIDAGIDFNHPNLAGKIWQNPGEINGQTGVDDDGDGLVDNVSGWDYFDNDNVPEDVQGHGTMTAGHLVASQWTSPSDGKVYGGIAPGAKVIPLKIDALGASTEAFDQRAGLALQWVADTAARHPEYNIVAVNLSIRSVDATTYAQYYQAPIQQLAAEGVFLAAASGNDHTLTAVDYPANDPTVLAVGGVGADGKVTFATDRGPKLGLLAPGNRVPSLEPGARYNVGGDGTSYATPFVTAAGALVRQVNPKFTPAQIISILQNSGADVADPLSGRTYKLLNVDAAIALAVKMTGPGGTPAETPFSGTPIALAGRLEVENFDNGGEGVAYHDSDAKNDGGRYRVAGVDLTKSGDTGAGYALYNTLAGEYAKYTVNVSRSGTYTLGARVARKGAGGTFHLELDGVKLTSRISVPDTGGWLTWRTITKTGLKLTAGKHVIKLALDAAGAGGGVVGNFNWLSFTRASAAVPAKTAPPPTSTARPNATPFATGRAGPRPQSNDLFAESEGRPWAS